MMMYCWVAAVMFVVETECEDLGVYYDYDLGVSRQKQKASLGVCYGGRLREKGFRRVCGCGVSAVGWFQVCLIVSAKLCSCGS